jgi:RNA polymerase sigma-70 factor (ECF subfamily)
MSDHNDGSGEFVNLMTRHQPRLFSYLLSLVGDVDSANDLLQETNVTLWKEWRKYEPGTNFKSWAFRVAHFEFMTHRQKRLRNRVIFSDELVATLAVEARAHDETHEQRAAALEACLEQIAPLAREVIRLRYTEGFAVSELASRMGRTANAVSQILFRARCALIDCVNRRDATEVG